MNRAAGRIKDVSTQTIDWEINSEDYDNGYEAGFEDGRRNFIKQRRQKETLAKNLTEDFFNEPQDRLLGGETMSEALEPEFARRKGQMATAADKFYALRALTHLYRAGTVTSFSKLSILSA